MSYRRILLFIVIVVLLLLLSTRAEAQRENFNTRVIYFVSEMLNTPRPVVEIEILPNREMRKILAEYRFNECVKQYNLPPGPIRIQCAVDESKMVAVLYGMWIPEDDPNHFHVLLNREAGLQTLLHEYFHYWLTNHSSPPGILNYSEQVVEAMASMVESSPSFATWLEDNR